MENSFLSQITLKISLTDHTIKYEKPENQEGVVHGIPTKKSNTATEPKEKYKNLE